MGSSRCGGMALYDVMAIVLLVALFASSAKCRPEPLDDGSKQEKESSNSSNGNGMALIINNSTATTTTPVKVNGSSSSGSAGDVKLVWCLMRNCVYEGRGNAPCYCCAAIKPNSCYETRDKCRGNCV